MTANAADLAIEDANNQTVPSNIIKSLQTLTSNIAEVPVGENDSHRSHNEESQKGNARPKANRGKRGRKKKVPPKPCQHPILPKMFAIQITPQPSVLASMGTFINQALLPSPAKLPLPSTSQPPTNSVVTSPKTAEVSNNKVSSTTTATSTRKKARASRSRKKSVKESIALAGKFHYASHDSEPTAFQSEDIILSGGFPQQNHRRIVHNATEKRRKEKINGWINKIATVLFKYNPEQKHKIYILEKAYEFISERSTNNLEEGKSQDAFTQSASTEQPGFPELVKKIAELENLVDALLAVIKKHKIPTQPNLMLSSYARSKLESFGITDAGNDSHNKDLTCPIEENSNNSTNVAISSALSDFVAEMTRHEDLDPSPTSVPPPTTNSMQNTPCVATSESFVLVSKAQQQHLADASQLTSIDKVSQLAQGLPAFSANVQLETLNRNNIETTVQKPIRTARQSSADMISTVVTPVAAPVTSLSVSENNSDLQKLTATTVQFSLNVPSAVQASHPPPAVSLNELALPGNTEAFALCKPHANLMPTVEPSLVAPVISLHQLPSTDIFHSSSQKQLAPSTNFVANIVPTPETPLVAPMTLQQNASIDQDLQLVISVENTLLNNSYLNSNTTSTPENGVFTNLQIAPKSTDIQLTSNQISPSFSLYSTASKKTQAITAKSSAPADKRSLNGSMSLVALTSTKSCPASIPSIPYNLHDMSLVSSNATCADYIGQNTHSGPNSQPGLKTHSDPNSLSSPNNQSGPNNHSGTSSHSASLVINKMNGKSAKRSNASKAPTMKSQMFVMKNMVQSRSKPINLDASFDSYFSSTSFDSLVNSAMSSDSIPSLTSTRDMHSMPVASVLASGAEKPFDTNTKTVKACNERTPKPQKTLPTIPGSSSPTLPLQTSASMDQDLQPASTHQRSSNPSRPSQPANASNKFLEFAKSLASSQSLQNMPNLLESGNLAQQSGQNLKRKRAPPKSSVHLQNRHSVTNLLSDACSTENHLSSVSDILTRTSDGFPVNDANAGVTGKSQVMNSSQPSPMTTLSENSTRSRVTSSISRKRHHNTTEGNDSTKSSENSQSINTSKMPQKRQKRAVTQRNASTPKSSNVTATSFAQGGASSSRNKNYRVSEGKKKARPESPLPSSIKGDSSLPRPHSIVSLARDKPSRTEENNRRKSEFSAESLLRNNSFPHQQQHQPQLKQQQQQQQQHQQQQQQLQQQQQPHNQQQHHQQLHNHQQYQQKQNQHHQQQQQNQQKQHQQQQMNQQQQQQQHHHHQQQQLNLLQNPHSNSHQDGNLPTILNIFAPASIGSMINPATSLGNMSNFSNFQNQATAPIVNISLPTIQSSFSNFSAEALIGGPVDTQQGASNTLNPVHNVHDNMLVPQENQNLFTDFSADTLLAGTESSLSYGIDNIMNRNESSISSSCISPNWLQTAPLIDSSPVRSSFNPGFNMFESTTGSQVHKSAPTSTNFILPGKWRPDFNKGDESNVNNGNFSIAGGTNVSMWGSGGLSGQQKPQQNHPSRARQKTAVKVQQSSKRGPSYGDFLLVDSTS